MSNSGVRGGPDQVAGRTATRSRLPRTVISVTRCSLRSGTGTGSITSAPLRYGWLDDHHLTCSGRRPPMCRCEKADHARGDPAAPRGDRIGPGYPDRRPASHGSASDEHARSGVSQAHQPSSSTERPLRAWQRSALARYIAAAPQDFLAVATPGAGKTAFALRVASELLADRVIDAITVVTPTEHLKTQWSLAAAAVGIALDPDFRNSTGATSADYRGIAVTYAGVAAHPLLHRARTEGRRTLVVLDEVHHAGDARSWGDAVKEAFDPAARRLTLTGTPFRSDDNPIPFVDYLPDGDGALRSRADHAYGYAEALADGVVRPVVFLAYSGQSSWRTSAGEEFTARLGEPMTAEQTARAYAAILADVTGTPPAVVLSDEPGASARVARFSGSEERWMVAVRMVSEGVDVPRLAVGVYATSASTPLFFAQAVGRFVRSRRPGETASVFVPSVPVLLGLASELEAQRDHVLGQPHRADEKWDDELLAQAQRTEDEPGEDEKAFTTLSAHAELDQLIYEGTSFSADEEDYLGLPGLLEPEQVRTLLNQRQKEWMTRGKRPAAAAAAPPPPAAALSVRERIHKLRKELNTLVSLHNHRTKKPHGVIHSELRAHCGGPPTAMATIEQLEERIATIRSWH